MLSIKKIVLAGLVVLVLTLIFMMYRDPNFMLEVADQVWNCF